MHLKQCLENCRIAVNAPIRKEGGFKISNFSFSLQNLEKEEEINYEVSRRKEIKMTRAKINTIEDEQAIEEIKIESGFNEKFGNNEKSPAGLIKMKEKKKKRR